MKPVLWWQWALIVAYWALLIAGAIGLGLLLGELRPVR